MAYHLSGTNPLPEPILTFINRTLGNRLHWHLNQNDKVFLQKKCIWKCYLQNVTLFAEALLCSRLKILFIIIFSCSRQRNRSRSPVHRRHDRCRSRSVDRSRWPQRSCSLSPDRSRRRRSRSWSYSDEQELKRRKGFGQSRESEPCVGQVSLGQRNSIYQYISLINCLRQIKLPIRQVEVWHTFILHAP